MSFITFVNSGAHLHHDSSSLLGHTPREPCSHAPSPDPDMLSVPTALSGGHTRNQAVSGELPRSAGWLWVPLEAWLSPPATFTAKSYFCHMEETCHKEGRDMGLRSCF